MKPGITAPLVFTLLFIGAIGHAWWSFEQATDLRRQAEETLKSVARLENQRISRNVESWLADNTHIPSSALISLQRGDVAVVDGKCLWPSGALMPVDFVRALLDDNGAVTDRVTDYLDSILAADPWLVRLWINSHPGTVRTPGHLEQILEKALSAETRQAHFLDPEIGLIVRQDEITTVEMPQKITRASLIPLDLISSRDLRVTLSQDNDDALLRLKIAGFNIAWSATEEGRRTLTLAANASNPLFSLSLALVIFVFGIRFLQKSRLELARRADMRERLVADISHELRTPVTTLRLYAEMLRDGRVTDPEKHHEYCKSLVRESSRLGRLIDNVLDFSRIGRGVLKVSPEPISLNDLAKKLVDSLAGIEGHERLHIDLPETTVYADVEATLRILANLVGNSLKYGAESNVNVQAENGCILVTDAGPGLPSSERATIFEPFIRGSRAQKDQIQGTGLGLAIARDLARAQGGDLECLAVDQGACFRLSFGELPT